MTPEEYKASPLPQAEVTYHRAEGLPGTTYAIVEWEEPHERSGLRRYARMRGFRFEVSSEIMNRLFGLEKEMPDIEMIAKQAYAAYGKVTDFKNFRGEPMPEWEDLPQKIQEAWRAAVSRVLDFA